MAGAPRTPKDHGMANKNLSAAKKAKQDEFYTQMNDIQAEINAYLDFDENTFRGKTVLLPCDDPEWSNFTLFFAQNFERLGLKKLISTSYAPESKTAKYGSLFEYAASQSDETPKNERGKIFVLDHDTNRNGRIDFEDLEWEYLNGDGDFRSDEVCRLRDEADVIVTNPPFSLFREFLSWILDGNNCLAQSRRVAEVGSRVPRDRDGNVLATKNTKAAKQFLIIGNMNAITYKEVFPLIKANKVWLGATGFFTDMVFRVPKGTAVAPADKAKAAKMGYVGDYTRLGNSCWFTNLDHGRRHMPLQLMTMAQNIKHSKHKEVRGIGYRKYDNYDAIEVSFTDSIPSDYDGVMGVPISFLDKYCPEQFEILGATESEGRGFSHGLWDESSAVSQPLINGERVYKRIFIRWKNDFQRRGTELLSLLGVRESWGGARFKLQNSKTPKLPSAKAMVSCKSCKSC